MKNLRKYAGALSRPYHCSFYDTGMQYALNGDTVALVVRDVYSTVGAVYTAPSKHMEETTEHLLRTQRWSGSTPITRMSS